MSAGVILYLGGVVLTAFLKGFVMGEPQKFIGTSRSVTTFAWDFRHVATVLMAAGWPVALPILSLVGLNQLGKQARDKAMKEGRA